MGHLNLCFPEWQGYAESNSVHFGTLALRHELALVGPFEDIDVPANEVLPIRHHIKGYDANLRQLRQITSLIQENQPDSTFMLGGTCAAEIAPVSWLNARYEQDLTVLWFDAHGDLNTPQSSTSKHFHGMPLRVLCGEGDEVVLENSFSVLSPDQVILVGARDLDEEEVNFIEHHRLTTVSTTAVDSLIPIVESKSSKHLYLHMDLDVLDPESFSHQLLPVKDGITTDQLLRAVSSLTSSFEVIGSSIVEYVPKNDSGRAFLQELVNVLGV